MEIAEVVIEGKNAWPLRTRAFIFTFPFIIIMMLSFIEFILTCMSYEVDRTFCRFKQRVAPNDSEIVVKANESNSLAHRPSATFVLTLVSVLGHIRHLTITGTIIIAF